MRKILILFLVMILLLALYFIVWMDIPSIESIYTYKDIQEAYNGYKTSLQTLDSKSNQELKGVENKLDPEYSKVEGQDEDNVVKLYNKNKQEYEYLLSLQKSNAEVDEADIYDIEYIWTRMGKYASQNFVRLNYNVSESDSDLDSEDYIMCNIDFDLVGYYKNIYELLDDMEADETLSFQINDFFMEGYYDTALTQSSGLKTDTENIIQGMDSEDGTYGRQSVAVKSAIEAGLMNESLGKFLTAEINENSDGKHPYDVKAHFRAYNVPINRRTVTNIKEKRIDDQIVLAEQGATLDSEMEDMNEEY